MKIKCLVTGLLLAAAIVPAAQGESLIDIYQKALRNDPSIREAAANRSATLQSKPQARGLLLPQPLRGRGQ